MKRVQSSVTLVVLIVLVVFAFFAIRRAAPKIQGRFVPEPSPQRATGESRGPLTTNRRLSDGSFNPNAPRKMKPTDNPSSLMLADNWRARYKSLLDGVRPAADRPGVYVYSFLDRTPDGVGTQFTYGWHLVGSAALASWTDARVAGAEPPAHYGIPEVDENTTSTKAMPDVEEWIRRALADPATADARYVVVGVYDTSPQTHQYSLTIRLADRKSPAVGGIVLYDSESPRRGDFESISAGQRKAAREMTDKLIALGIAAPRRAPKGAKPPLEPELDRVACLLDSSDSWAVMDGIDQALALQALYPAETLPLQAASYGMNALRWVYFNYAIKNDYGNDYALRAYALAQVALAMDPKPAMSHLNWIHALKLFNILPASLVKSVTGEDVTRKNPELESYRRCVLDDYNGEIPPGFLQHCPDWIILYLENRQTMFDGQPHAGRPYLRARVSQWHLHDLYLLASALDMTSLQYETAARTGFYRRAKASIQLTQASFANELATIMSAQRLPREDCDFLASLVGAEDRDMREMAEERDFYKTREYLLECLRSWSEPPDSSDQPVFKVLAWTESRAASLIADPHCTVTKSGYAGFEFTPAERVRFAHWRDNIGPMMYVSFLHNQLGSYEHSTKLASVYVNICPRNAMAQFQYADFLGSRVEENILISFQRRNALKAAYANLPLNDDTPYVIGRMCFYLDDVPQGLAYIRQFSRQNPFSVGRPHQIAQLYKRYGYHAMAVKYYDETLKAMPRRYDIANERAWSLCQMGEWKDPGIRETFARPVKLLPGNSSFHQANLDYLYNWAGETTSSREAASFFRQCKPRSNSPVQWMFNIERFDGKTSKALEILEQNLELPEDVQGLARAAHDAFVASRYLDLKMPDKAKPFVDKAARIDDWKQDVIQVMGDYALATGDYDKALQEYQREIKRYGHSTDVVHCIASCYEKKGMNDKAMSLLENEILTKSRHSSVMQLASYLMYFYAEKGDKEKGRQLMDKVLGSSQRTRSLIANTLTHYKKLNPEEAADIRKRMNEIMAGPMLDEQASER